MWSPEGVTNHRKGRFYEADRSLEPGERPQRADSRPGAGSPPPPRESATPRKRPRELVPDGGTKLAAGGERASSCLPARRGFPAGYQRLPGEARLSTKAGRRKKSGGTRRGTRHQPFVLGGERRRRLRHHLRVPRANGWISPAARREAVPARRRS